MIGRSVPCTPGLASFQLSKKRAGAINITTLQQQKSNVKKNQKEGVGDKCIFKLSSSHLDNLCLISDIKPKISRNYTSRSRDVVSSSLSQFSNSFFYRTINYWNTIPLEIRRLKSVSDFELGVGKHLWDVARPVPGD